MDFVVLIIVDYRDMY